MSTPRFSVLLPTRNGGRFLDACIQSVLADPRPDLELVVSDNANEDETADVVARHSADPRLVAIRLDAPVTVTENWNAALAAASGEYVLMIGDDDLLLPGYFERISEALRRYDEPDCLTCNAFRYLAPGSIAGQEPSFYAEDFFVPEPQIGAGGPIAPEYRRGLVRDMFRFKVRFPLTMQTTLVAREAASRLPNGLFQPPFPDHYALGGLLLRADTWAYDPMRPLVVGVSPKSFGHFYFNLDDSRGLDYLGIAPEFDGLVAGNDVLNVLHEWLLVLKRDFPADLDGLEIDRGEYLLRQLWASVQDTRGGALPRQELRRRLRALHPRDWARVLRALARGDNLRHALSVVRLSARDRTHPLWGDLKPLATVQGIEQFSEWVTATGRA